MHDLCVGRTHLGDGILTAETGAPLRASGSRAMTNAICVREWRARTQVRLKTGRVRQHWLQVQKGLEWYSNAEKL